MILVRQREGLDCGVACVAMVTGRPYEEARALFPMPMAGTDYMGVKDALWDLGFASHVLYRWRQSDRKPRAWPPFEDAPLPWIVQVVGPAGGHYVVLDEQRRVLCPASYFTDLVWSAAIRRDDESAFRAWYVQQVEATAVPGFRLDANPDAPEHHYDWRAAYYAGATPVLDSTDGRYHWPSCFKADSHPNRFVDGVDTKLMGRKALSGEVQHVIAVFRRR